MKAKVSAELLCKVFSVITISELKKEKGGCPYILLTSLNDHFIVDFVANSMSCRTVIPADIEKEGSICLDAKDIFSVIKGFDSLPGSILFKTGMKKGKFRTTIKLGKISFDLFLFSTDTFVGSYPSPSIYEKIVKSGPKWSTTTGQIADVAKKVNVLGTGERASRFEEFGVKVDVSDGKMSFTVLDELELLRLNNVIDIDSDDSFSELYDTGLFSFFSKLERFGSGGAVRVYSGESLSKKFVFFESISGLVDFSVFSYKRDRSFPDMSMFDDLSSHSSFFVDKRKFVEGVGRCAYFSDHMSIKFPKNGNDLELVGLRGSVVKGKKFIGGSLKQFSSEFVECDSTEIRKSFKEFYLGIRADFLSRALRLNLGDLVKIMVKDGFSFVAIVSSDMRYIIMPFCLETKIEELNVK